MSKITVSTLLVKKEQQQKIVSLTCYDASFAKILDDADVDVILVGDSLGMVVQGQDSTLPVTIDDMVYHTQMVNRGIKHSLLVADMPFMSYASPQQALETASRLMKQGGAHMVKLEGGFERVEIIEALVKNSVPVCGHLGLLPQSVHKLGGYKVQGRVQCEAAHILAEARALEEAGVSALVLECVPEALAKKISKKISVPTIGIGAGVHCDGQILVLYDILGLTSGTHPSFVRNFLQDNENINAAVLAYCNAVRNKTFPGKTETFN
ncbi:MAG: 3-methyl-2-oxobutanoate hydroxymethyltransferase [Methylococcales bacterium]|jgi:3-methyl-2-oxobutanoate hydroxymethyltransferase|nr:3-methyl-2-oxobutanoate hydroxymethyltransferase [Methylococcales bacterium]MBT7408169.1 3-methyl-2-oxobutanoate hydroxymethyltransferase [Methylococcales bacterium]